MHMSKRGDIGFPEAMMAVMVACIVISAYLGAVVLSSDQTGDVPVFDRSVTDAVRIEGGRATGDLEKPIVTMMERNGYRGVSVLCSIPGTDAGCDSEFTVGMMDGSISYDRFMRSVYSDDGQVLPVVFRVTICI